jgi:phage N-6-adenine-methyltransferase
MTTTEFRDAQTVTKPTAKLGRPTVRRNGVPLTDAERAKRYRQAHKRRKNQNNFEWHTPPDVIKAARKVLGSIDLDPTSCELANTVVKAKKIFTREDNGLEHEWHGNVWLNPPYTRQLIDLFVEKLIKEITAGHVKQAILMCHPRTDTEWFRLAASSACSICFAKRIRFLRPYGVSDDPKVGIVFLYYGKDKKQFRKVFVDWGVFVNCEG